jgi:glutathione synthase/RimK-type ligase-like ATP-grasp enzyme
MILKLKLISAFPTNILIKSYCQQNDIAYRFINPFEEVFDFSKLKGDEVILPRSSGVLFDDLDLHLAEELEKRGHKVVNNSQALRILRDKDRQLLRLEREKLKPLPYALLRGKVDQASDYLKSRLGECPDGYLVKSIRSNLGKGQFKTENNEELTKLWSEFLIKQDQRYIITPFMKEFKEYRVLFLGDEFFAVEKAPGLFGHQRNSDNSDFSPFEITKEMKALSMNVKKSFQLDYGALDLVLWNDQLYILEVNGLPGFSHVEKVLEKNLTEKFIGLL